MHRRAALCHARPQRASTAVLGCLLAAALSVPAAPAGAVPNSNPNAAEDSSCEVTDTRRALAIGASVFPGAVVHGAGHWVACEPSTALRLLYLEAAAVGATVVSLAGLAGTGASRYVVAPLALGALGGVGLFTTTWLADIYGVTAPRGGTGTPRAKLPRLWIQTGLRGVYDPLFETSWLVSHAIRVDSDLLWASGRMDVAPDARHRRYALLLERRLLGERMDRSRHARWAFDGRLGWRDFAESNEEFGMTTVELALAGRVDLGLIGPTLEGAFVDVEAGYAREWHRFDGLPGYTWDALLGRVGFGAYLGHGPGVRGEAWVAYDHRRDTVAGGLRLPGIPAGYAGYLEHRSELYFDRRWGAAVEVAYGSAFVASAYLLFQLPR